jgi:hypothetical protein
MEYDMKKKYYVVLLRPDTQGYIAGEVIFDEINSLKDVEYLTRFVLDNQDISDKTQKWLLLNWKEFKENDNA